MCSLWRSLKVPGQFRSGIFVFRFLFPAVWLISVGVPVFAQCPPPTAGLPSAQLLSVIDGDTLLLRDRRKIRLLDINTPELGRDGRSDERWAQAAKQAVADFLGKENRLILDIYGKDRYNRHLAEVYREDGQMLSEHLLQAGLGWRILVPPLPHSRGSSDKLCLYQAEEQARRQKRGLWSHTILNSKVATSANQGFTLMRGRVEQVATSQHSTWIDLEGDVVLHISHRDLHWFSAQDVSQWRGQTVEVRGWLRSRKPPRSGLASLRMDLRHPAMIELLGKQLDK
ncbi:thermonuclease family protein [Spongiibacter sp. KMU-158]|uniref:Thermonuclease family protein n=1 Tax=Spongiibacter pelagi TaxID=2760804 RepID=A0A927GUU8_9GAMM|nr:thermonuclease family protein [Spongiibacter pelagi]MBD2857705.1 thermonuclease family protein [Spongiibacter pelagi]